MPVSPRTALIAALLFAAGTSHAADAMNPSRAWGATLTATSDYVLRGISQSDGGPAAQGDVHFYVPTAGKEATFVGGLWASTVRLPPTDETSVELDAYLGYLWNLTEAWSAKLTFVHYAYPWSDYASHRSYDELGATLSWRDRLSVGATVAPDVDAYWRGSWRNNRTVMSYDAAWRNPLGSRWSTLLSAGYYDLERITVSGYWYWSAGVSYQWESLHVDVGYYGTDSTARRLYATNGLADDRLATTVTWRF